MRQTAVVDYLDMLASRHEVRALEFVRDCRSTGTALRTIYAGLFAAALDESAARTARDEQSTAQELFVAQATDRIMSVFEPELLAEEVWRGPMLCATFEADSLGLQCRIAAALFTIDGYDVCQLGAEATLDELERVVRHNTPLACVLFASTEQARASRALAVERLHGYERDEGRRTAIVCVSRALEAVERVESGGATACGGAR